MRVIPAEEPADFDELVRQPGLDAIAELVGEESRRRRSGRKRQRVARNRTELKPEDFPPIWPEATDDLLDAYHRICAYACLYIERITGSATVDHWAPKALTYDKVYEWTNYRLACSLMNSRKRAFGDVMDPFEVEDGFFALDLITLEAIPGPRAGAQLPLVEATIERLGLNRSDYSEALGDYFHDYMDGNISLQHLERRAPFLAKELRRQGKLRQGHI